MSEVITWKRVPVIGDKAFPTLEEAQEYQLVKLFEPGAVQAGYKDNASAMAEDAARWIVANKAKVLDILTTDENSRPAARKINGGTKKRKPQPQVDPQAELCKT